MSGKNGCWQRWAVFLAGITAVNAGAEFQIDALPSAGGTNVVFSRPILVTSNWFFAAGYVAATNREQVEKAFVFARPRPASGSSGQWLAPAEGSAEFGNSMAFADGILIVKDAFDTWFFHEEKGQWLPEDKLTSDSGFLERSGPVAVNRYLLVSGSEVYRWPSREFIATLRPANANPGNYTVAAAAIADNHVVLSFTVHGVWSFSYSFETGKMSPGEYIPPPAGAETSGFGAVLASSPYPDLLIGAPYDSDKGANAGAVHRYTMFAAENGWTHMQKFVPAEAMPGDRFGSAIASDDLRIYIGAPFRNEDHQQAGALFIYELDLERHDPVPVWRERERVKIPNAPDFARLGLNVTAFQRRIYATSGLSIIAFRAPITLRLAAFNGEISLSLPAFDPWGSLESTSDPSGDWTSDPAPKNEFEFRTTIDPSKNRLFRVRLDPSF